MRVRRAKAFLFAVAAFAGINEGCDCGSEHEEKDEGGCGYDCKQACTSALPQGLIGGYTSVAKGPDGSLHVAGYNDAAYSTSVDAKYGDLVYGIYDPKLQAVTWQTVDGVPGRTDASCPTADRKGWRGGEDSPGDDVGLFTSLQLDAKGRAMIAYYDYTHKRLRFARIDGGWSSYAITEEKKGTDLGRYAKQMIVAGRPVVIFSGSEPIPSTGKRLSKVSIAKALTDFPGRASDWKTEDIFSFDQAACLPGGCEDGSSCIKDTGTCTKAATGCTPACAEGSACVLVSGKPACQAVKTEAPVPAPDEIGDYLQVAQSASGIAVVAYDAIHGDLLGLSNASGSWKKTILDGNDADVGVSPTVAVDSKGDWHVAYVNLGTGALQYLFVTAGNVPSKPEIVDSATGIAGQPFPDGLHKVGDDAEIRVAADGTIELLYQDATAGTLRYAKGVPAAGKHTWTVSAAAQPGRFAGFFPHWVPGGDEIVNFWRVTNAAEKTISGNVAVLPHP